ncbi:RB1-inducible coiled-coil protein 1 isoform X1 [Tribolium castaneum]|uniref:RB1-inducible coiled-coil protein 1 isoform X1 n=1 Tax=Tribolium castaneum TaxID=7070 RepID=UPI00046BFD9D|nr:PREDICTED: RB1-inducible coiled-coil protein 1 isoform X1 [Tribolium castaneum]XP_008194412.1 PREDICTED: RB1-inducible coiled-coil protein 1 isoform X1 [Tribolium castaneum]|eukprot:XP_008194411.1 PREDICTED: RB1-inducible coiled-coil protein 1 isoform X1 [Tribolium castaneum]
MLFVFQVDTGRMMTFDMSLALESVQNLKSHVELAFKIPVDKQVLLISGGEHLRPDDRVCSYPAGTDTNPIFLFSKAVIESDQPPAASVDYGSEQDLSSKVRESSELPATLSTVQKRTQLARLFCELSQSQMTTCEKLVHEQHLQQQGWSAVVANLEDLYSDLKHRWKLYQDAFNEYIAKRDSYLEFLNHFKDDLLVLQKIPVLPALIESQKLLVPEQDDFSEDKQSGSVRGEMTLHEWISQRDDFMDCLFEICSKGLIQTDEKEFLALQEEIETKLAMTDDVTMKEIKGLGDRLFGLEKLMVDAKRYVNEQMRLAESFQRNQSRASQVKEASILPALCATHLQQLDVLLENHNRLRDITRRCILAKDELSSNLYHRLKWIVFMEDNLSEFDNKLVFHFQNLLSLQRQLEILQQVHTAPTIYLSSIVEVVRRRKVSQAFLLWASDVACHLLTIYNEEIARRKDFQAQIEGHFLSSLFPGMEDFPPSFATQAPSIFDSSLPKLTEEDVENLRRALPDLAECLQIPDTSIIENYFMLKDSKDDLDKTTKTVEDKLIEVVAEVGLASNLDQTMLKAIEGEPQQTTPHGLPHLKDLDKGCESETDTEEFEKVGQSPFDLHFDKGIPSPRPGTQDASTLTEDNLQISRSEYEKLHSFLIRLSHLSRLACTNLKSELIETKNHILREKVMVEEACGNLKIQMNNIILDKEKQEREIVQRLTVDHELEISDFRKIAQSKNEEIKGLRDENARLSSELRKVSQENLELKEGLEAMSCKSSKEMDDMKKRMDEVLAEKERSTKEEIERLKSEYKSEMENIRARFKLMTMERSPSENSLEKIERGDYPSITNHEALLLQMTENFESEKEVAVSDAVSKESQRWQKILDDRIKQMECDFEQEKAFLIQNIQSRIQQDQEKQINQLREQINNLNLECIKYKDTIQQLAEYREESDCNELMRRIDSLEREKTALKNELKRIKVAEPPPAMAASVAVCEGAAATADAATSPVKTRKRSETSSPKAGKLNIDSCKAGDLVLVVWDIQHQNFKILQESSSLYFLNADCLESLGLKVVDGQPNKLYCYAEVVEKEYCHARKDENYSLLFQPVNRFRVPQGTKFFRVKVKPPPSGKEMPPAQFQAPTQTTHMSQSQTTVSQVVDIIATAGPSHSLPSSPSKISWEKSGSQEAPIPEEKGEDSAVGRSEDSGGKNEEDIEKGTELTENFHIDNHSIDRIEENCCLLLSPQK